MGHVPCARRGVKGEYRGEVSVLTVNGKHHLGSYSPARSEEKVELDDVHCTGTTQNQKKLSDHVRELHTGRQLHCTATRVEPHRVLVSCMSGDACTFTQEGSVVVVGLASSAGEIRAGSAVKSLRRHGSMVVELRGSTK